MLLFTSWNSSSVPAWLEVWWKKAGGEGDFLKDIATESSCYRCWVYAFYLVSRMIIISDVIRAEWREGGTVKKNSAAAATQSSHQWFRGNWKSPLPLCVAVASGIWPHHYALDYYSQPFVNCWPFSYISIKGGHMAMIGKSCFSYLTASKGMVAQLEIHKKSTGDSGWFLKCWLCKTCRGTDLNFSSMPGAEERGVK